MRYLFGDSTESALEFNYLAFLRDALDACVVVLQSDAGLASGRDRKQARERAASEAVHAVEAFGKTAHQLAEPVAHGAPETPVGRAAAAVAHAATDAVRRESAQARAALQADLELIETEGQRLRARCTAALGALLQTHDLPDAEESLQVRWNGGAYEAKLKQKSKFGAEVLIELEIPSSSIFAHDVRIDRIADGAEVHAPESAGWLKKEVKMVPHKLGRHHVTEVIVTGHGITFKARATSEAGAQGFDIHISRKGEVSVDRGTGEGPEGLQFSTDERDVGKLTILGEKLEAAADGLREHRKSLAAASLDGSPISEHAHPRVLAERLIEAMAPVVRQIAQHSLSPRELVLKRLLAGDRREEIFVSKSELAQKLEALPASLRKVFAPLGLEDGAPAERHERHERPERQERPEAKETREAPPALPGVPERVARKTAPPPAPPPPPPPRLPQQATAAAIDTALRELDEAEGGEPEPADATRPR